jgi:hypothetical protein
MVVGSAKAVFGDMHVPDPELALEEDAEAVHKIDLSIPDRFDLGTCQYHASIVFVFDGIVVIGAAVPDLTHGGDFIL